MTGLFGYMITRPVVMTAVKVSVFVGTCLNLINQGPGVWAGEAVHWGKFLLNYAVPYCVATYSAAKAKARPEG